jgi:hypothetical protein
VAQQATITRIAGGLIYDFPNEKSCIPPHTHDEVSHYCYVIKGLFEISCETGKFLAKPGDYIDFPIGENHCIQPLEPGAVFNRFHGVCAPEQLVDLLESDLGNLRSASMKKQTQTLLWVAGAGALLYYLFAKSGTAGVTYGGASGPGTAACPNPTMGCKNFGVNCPTSWC